MMSFLGNLLTLSLRVIESFNAKLGLLYMYIKVCVILYKTRQCTCFIFIC